MQTDARAARMQAVQARPLAELLWCPPATAELLNGAAECLPVECGDAVFRQGSVCRGLYVAIAGMFLRRSERLDTRFALGPVRPGELVELAAALGDGKHTYTLTAQEPGTLMLLPQEALHRAFEQHPPLRMQLLEELAREVSRGYHASCVSRESNMRGKNFNGAHVE